MKVKLIIGTLILSIVLAYAGFVGYGTIFSMLLPRIDNAHYVTSTMTGELSVSLRFGLLWGLFPVIILLTWVITKTNDYQGRLLSIGLILAFMLAALAVRYFMIIAMAIEAAQVSKEVGITVDINIEDLKYDLYLFLGQIAGFLTTFFILKKRHDRRLRTVSE